MDYDTDDSGLYRARGENQVTKNVKRVFVNLKVASPADEVRCLYSPKEQIVS